MTIREEDMEENQPRQRSLTPRGLWRVASYRFGFYRLPERVQMAVAWHLPRWLVGWAGVRMFSYRTTRSPYGECSGMPFTEIYQRWEQDRKRGVNDG